MSNEEQIQALIEEAGNAFSALDFDRWLNCFHSPRTVILPGSVFSSGSYDESKAALMPVFERVQQKGFKRTQLDLCNIRILSDTTAIASTVWTRFGSDEQVLERLGATYMLLHADGQWKIAVLTAHGADVIVVTESIP